MSAIRPSAADVTSALRGIDFPASKEDLITYVHEVRDRAQAVLEILHQFPERRYNSMADVEKTVGEITYRRVARRIAEMGPVGRSSIRSILPGAGPVRRTAGDRIELVARFEWLSSRYALSWRGRGKSMISLRRSRP